MGSQLRVDPEALKVLTWDTSVETTVGATAAPNVRVCIVITLVARKYASNRDEQGSYPRDRISRQLDMRHAGYMQDVSLAVSRATKNAITDPALEAASQEEKRGDPICRKTGL